MRMQNCSCAVSVDTTLASDTQGPGFIPYSDFSHSYIALRLHDQLSLGT